MSMKTSEIFETNSLKSIGQFMSKSLIFSINLFKIKRNFNDFLNSTLECKLILEKFLNKFQQLIFNLKAFII